jgi:hypothetical protein
MSSAQHRHHDRPAWSFTHRGDDVAGYSLRTCLRACSRLLSLTFGIAQVTAFNGEGLLSTHATSNSMHLSTIVTNSNHLSNNCHEIQSTSGFKMCVARLVYRMRMRRPSQLRDQQSIYSYLRVVPAPGLQGSQCHSFDKASSRGALL